jgi:hypothetical protein
MNQLSHFKTRLWIATIWSIAAVFVVDSIARGASPNLSALRPTGGRRGTEVEVNLTGARLGDAREILFYEPGITVTKLEKVNDGHVKATFKIAGDARLGLYDLRIATATGIGELRTFSVGALAETNEVEPNNDFTNPQKIALDTTVNGVAENEDVDYFVVEAKKGERICAEVEGIRLGITFFDPYVAILNEKRFELASSDDSPLIRQDAFAALVVPADGRYIVQVRESAYAGNGSCLYRLHVGRFPRVRAIVPAGGRLGEKAIVRGFGDVLGTKTIETKLPAESTVNFGLQVSDDKGFSPYPNAFRLAPFGDTIEAEPNDDHPRATAFETPRALDGTIDKPGDVDHFVFKAKKGQTFDARVFARSLGSPLDSVVYIFKKGNGGGLVANDDSQGPDSYVRFTVPEDGEYIVAIYDHLKKGGPDYFYRVEVAPVAARLELSVPNEALTRGTGTIAAAIPRGNRQAILINAARADFGGDLKLAFDNLPAGATVDADVMAASVATIPVVFSAPADAKLSSALIHVSGKHIDSKVQIPFDFRQTAELVLGQNNIPVWTRSVETLAASIVEECPYEIEIVEPKVPIVRGGSMGLKVIAKRKPGFTAPIGVSLPWNPPGISSAGGISIPEKQNEAVIPINADGGAEIRTWKIVVNGASNVASGPIVVSSSLAKLSVAERYVTFAFQAASVEQGKEVDLGVTVTKLADFPGEAKATLVGLPNMAVAEPRTITKDTKNFTYRIKTDKATPAGNHVNLFCQVIVIQNGEPIVHNLGTGQLRVDVPLPPKPATVAAKPAPAQPAPPPKPAAAPPRPLGRLEKLRLEQKERAAAAAANAGESKPNPEGAKK